MYRDTDRMIARMARKPAAAAARGRSGDALRRMRRQGRPGPAVARAGAARAGARRRCDRRARRAGRCRRDRAAGRQASGADGRFLPRLHRRSVCVRRNRREPCAQRRVRNGRDAAPRARDRGRSAGSRRGRSRRRCFSCSPARAPASTARTWRWSAGIRARASLRSAFRSPARSRRSASYARAGSRPGDALILTRPLGTGVLFAAAMRARANAAWIEAALAAMRQSNRAAAAILREHGADGHDRCHRLRPDRPSRRDAGGEPCGRRARSGRRSALSRRARARAGRDRSTLLPENLTLASLLRGEVDAPLRALLFDPQTSGGLLAGVPADRAAACVMALRSNGYVHATIVGRVTDTVGSAQDVSIAVGRGSL